MNDYKFGNFLCSVREARGLTQTQVAEALGITAAAVSKWENGSAKPRVEMLFRLAELLEVRPEELMAGEYLQSEFPDPEAMRKINERYELLQRVDESNTASLKLKRLVAWLIDWNVIGLFILLVAGAYAAAVIGPTDGSNAAIIGLFPIFLLYPTLFILRDVIFGGRSLGKRIFGLVILDKRSGEPLRGKELAIRNLFLIVLQFDAIIMLVSGYSIGDRCVNACVALKNSKGRSEETTVERINSYSGRDKSNKRNVIISIVAIFGAFILLFCLIAGIVFLVLNNLKKSEEYAVAYEYLVNSEAYLASNTAEEDIRFNTYSGHTSTNQNGEAVRTVEMGFILGGGKKLTVTVHKTDVGWEVCEECTLFK